MSENTNNEVMNVETTEVAVTEPKEGIVKKTGKFIKNHWKEAVAFAGGLVLGGLAIAHTVAKAEDDYDEEPEVIDVEYSVEDEDAE